MSEEIIKFNIPSDNDGFVSFNCPFCKEKFKLRVPDVESDDVIYLFCPYCGLQDKPSKFISQEALEQAKILAINKMKSVLNDAFGDLERNTRNNKYVTFKVNKKLDMEDEKTLFEIEDAMELVNLKCCNKNVKTRCLEIYCPYCGVK